MKYLKFTMLLAAAVLLIGSAMAQNQVSTLRGAADLSQNNSAPPISKVVNSDLRQARNYPEQPPLIPHKTDNYQIDTKVNQCLQCHQRRAVEVTQAPMVSVTHFIGRDNQVLAEISPRRYFCTQCHVTQTDARLLVENTFVDSEDIIDYLKSKDGETK
jgi:nitrate reductase (cytochrome), electron transfer subunit